MKFISKNTNLRIILKPGIPAQPVLGIPAVGCVSVKFQDGLVEIRDQKIIDKMLTHAGYNTDFIAVDDDGNDPFAYTREEAEPGHVITEMKYGHVERSLGTPKKTKLSPEMYAALSEMANEMANKRIKEMLPSLMEDTLKKMAMISAEKQSIKEESVNDINPIEGDSSLLDNDTIKVPTQEDFEEAEIVDDVDLEKTLENATIMPPIDLDILPKKKAGRPSKK